MSRKRFTDWFRLYGMMNDIHISDDISDYLRYERIAYRAYKRGLYDAKRKKRSK